MIAAEFGEIVKKLYGAYGILSERDQQVVWFEQLRNIDYSEVEEAVNDWIRYNAYKPSIADIVEGAKRIRSVRQTEKNFRQMRLVKCPICGDTGLVVKETPRGGFVGSPCTSCNLGRERYPWYFMSEEDKERWFKEEEKQGRKPPRHPHVASDEFYLMYHYGIDHV